ncbi:ABC transporter permease [candidate division KSB1 bacterium]
MKNRICRPPKIAELVLSMVSKSEINFSVAGDMEEEFNDIREERGRVTAVLWYIRQVGKASLPFMNHSFRRSTGMFKNYLKTTFRNIRRNKVTSFINIAGLSVGISFALLVYLFIEDEFSYDRFHKDSDRIYRVYKHRIHPEYGENKGGSTPIRIADDFRSMYPEIEYLTRISTAELVIKRGELVFQEQITFVDQDFFETFSFPVIQGDPEILSTNLNSVVISEEMAEKYFLNEDPVGKTIDVVVSGRKMSFIIASVVDNCSDKSSIPFDFLAPYDLFKARMSGFMLTSYRANNPAMFIKLRENADIANFQGNFLRVTDTIDHGLAQGETLEYHIENINKIHLNTEVSSSLIRMSDPIYSQIFAGLGGIVLFIACINFMTLSIGLSKRRFREVGMRKVMGAFRSMLMKQFLGETIISSFFALFLGIVLAVAFLPLFNELSNKNIVFQLSPLFVFFMVSLAAVIGIISGMYPSFIQSRCDAVNVLKGTHRTGGRNYFSKGLIIVQFSLSIILIVITVVFQMQLDFITERDLGFDNERLLELKLYTDGENAVQKFERFSNAVTGDNRILDISAASSNYGLTWGKTVFWTRLGFDDNQGNRRTAHFNQVGYNYLNTMEIDLVEGRNFSREFGSDYSNAIIVNEKAVKELGIENPIGKKIDGISKETQQIIGVVKDFHYGSMHGEIRPLILALSCESIDMDKHKGIYGFWPHVYEYAQIKLAPGDPMPVVDFIRSSWKEISPDSPFDLRFVDEVIQMKYESERKWGKIVRSSSVFAILIACLGLFGLSLISVQERIREVGIRKVLGASAGSIVNLVSREMVLLVIISSVVAWPAAYVITSKWLLNFAYKIDLSVMIFFESGLIALIIASVTISFQTFRAAYTNPVDTLRYE